MYTCNTRCTELVEIKFCFKGKCCMCDNSNNKTMLYMTNASNNKQQHASWTPYKFVEKNSESCFVDALTIHNCPSDIDQIMLPVTLADMNGDVICYNYSNILGKRQRSWIWSRELSEILG